MTAMKSHQARTLGSGTQLSAVYAALWELPGVPMTSQELADETGLSLKFCSGYMYTLRQLGLAQSAPADPQGGHRQGTLLHWVGERR